MKEQGSALPEEPGDIVTTSGEVLGRHAGLHQYTVGQRKGLGISTAHPMYVVSLDRAQNRLVVGEDRELRSTTCEVRNVNWIPYALPDGPVQAKSASAIVTSPRQPKSSRSTPRPPASPSTSRNAPSRRGRPLYFIPATKFWAAAGFGRARPAERAGRILVDEILRCAQDDVNGGFIFWQLQGTNFRVTRRRCGKSNFR